MPKNKEKSKQLGQPFGTASAQLRKKIMFHLAVECGCDICYQCGNPIESIDDFSIEHKIPWLNSEDPQGLFFSIENIAFSHNSCNASNRRHSSKFKETKSGYRGVCFDAASRHGKKPWKATISFQGKSKTIGYYSTTLEAAEAYDKAALELHKERAVTNKSLGLI